MNAQLSNESLNDMSLILALSLLSQIIIIILPLILLIVYDL